MLWCSTNLHAQDVGVNEPSQRCRRLLVAVPQAILPLSPIILAAPFVTNINTANNRLQIATFVWTVIVSTIATRVTLHSEVEGLKNRHIRYISFPDN